MLQPRYAFVVRIWQEGRAWRGSLEASSTGEAAYFASLGRLAELLSQTTGWSGSGEQDEPAEHGTSLLDNSESRSRK